MHKICVYGAGAIGGHIAARLAKGGAAVSVVARGPHLEAIQRDGLTVVAPDGVLHCRPAASDDPAELGPQDAVIVTVKAPALPAVAAGIAPLLGPETAVAFVMNGIPWWYFDAIRHPRAGTRLEALDPGGALREAVGIARVLGGVVYSSAAVAAPGVVHASNADARVVLGEIDDRRTPRVAALAAAIEAGGMGGVVAEDIRAAVWEKLLGNLMTGALCVLARSSMRDTLADPGVRAAAAIQAEEINAIATAYGYPLGGSGAVRIARQAASAHKPSILQDLEAGRPMEVAAIWQVPLMLAEWAGVKVPTLALTTGLATQLARSMCLAGDGV
jgi:2-dehydropantoate 2-reductase